MLDTLMSYVPLIMLAGILFIPYGMLTNETYKAVYKVSKVPIGTAILHYVPFYNYIMTRKYLYGSALPATILTILSVGCMLFRVAAILIWGRTNPWMIAISVYVAIAGICLWYITMMFTSLYTAILIRSKIYMLVLGTVIAPFGAFIVSKNIRKFFKQNLEVNSEFRDTNGA